MLISLLLSSSILTSPRSFLNVNADDLSNSSQASSEQSPVPVDNSDVIDSKDKSSNDVKEKDNPVQKINHPPRARAGPDLSIKQGETAILNARNSSDIDGDNLKFYWKQVSPSKPRVLISNARTDKTTITVPPNLIGSLLFLLTVTDGNGGIGRDLVNIKIEKMTTLPEKLSKKYPSSSQKTIDNEDLPSPTVKENTTKINSQDRQSKIKTSDSRDKKAQSNSKNIFNTSTIAEQKLKAIQNAKVSSVGPSKKIKVNSSGEPTIVTNTTDIAIPKHSDTTIVESNQAILENSPFIRLDNKSLAAITKLNSPSQGFQSSALNTVITEEVWFNPTYNKQQLPGIEKLSLFCNVADCASSIDKPGQSVKLIKIVGQDRGQKYCASPSDRGIPCNYIDIKNSVGDSKKGILYKIPFLNLNTVFGFFRSVLSNNNIQLYTVSLSYNGNNLIVTIADRIDCSPDLSGCVNIDGPITYTFSLEKRVSHTLPHVKISTKIINDNGGLAKPSEFDVKLQFRECKVYANNVISCTPSQITNDGNELGTVYELSNNPFSDPQVTSPSHSVGASSKTNPKDCSILSTTPTQKCLVHDFIYDVIFSKDCTVSTSSIDPLLQLSKEYLCDITLNDRVDDTDGDGIRDTIEINGIHDSNGLLITDMKALGSDPCRKTIAVEIDYMEGSGHTHRPMSAAIDDAITMFNNAPGKAPVSKCPYPGFPTHDGGVNLIIDISDAIPEQSPIDDFAFLDSVKSTHFNPAKKPYFHYNLWAHNYARFPGSSGLAELPGNDFIVSLGSFENQVGNRLDQAGTFVHELGHNLGLHHGGSDDVNCKPNYISVMSYAFQLVGIFSNSNGGVTNRIDYSKEKLPQLDENNLNENSGISDGNDYTYWADSNGIRSAGLGSGPLDWNGNLNSNDNPVTVDISHQNDACNDGLQPLQGFNDWPALRIKMENTGDYVDGVHRTSPVEITAQQAKELKESLDKAFSPDLQVTKKADLINAIPGDTIHYTVFVKNIGKGKATGIQLTDTFANGNQEKRQIADLDTGKSSIENFAFKVPFPIKDGLVVSNTVKVTGKGVVNDLPDVNMTNNEDKASTTVHMPNFKLSKSKVTSGSAKPGEEIKYHITYQNIGTGDAKNIVISDTLPKGVYYSLKLDTGTGPKPNKVTKNSDGTITVLWNIPEVKAGLQSNIIEYSVRPSLIFTDDIKNNVVLDFSDANNNDYPSLNAFTTTPLSRISPTGNPQPVTFWMHHREFWTPDILAKIQATDDRFDGADGSKPDGILSPSEVAAIPANAILRQSLTLELLGTYFNLATGKISADTLIPQSSGLPSGVKNVKNAVEFALNLLLSPNSANSPDYSKVLNALRLINGNVSQGIPR